MGVDAVITVRGSAPVADVIASLTRDVADFPLPGIQFKDLTPLFANRAAMSAVIDALADVASGADLVAGIESRGSLVAAAIAARLGTGVLSIRKSGKLPPPVLSEDYDMEYGSDTLEIPADSLELRGPQRGARRRRVGHRWHHRCGQPVAAARRRHRDRRGGGGGAHRAGRTRGNRPVAGAQFVPVLIVRC